MKCRLGRFNRRQHWRRSDRAREGELEGIELSALDKFAYNIVGEVDKTSDHATTDDTRRGETRARPWRPPGRRPRCSRTAPQRLPPHIVRWLMTVASPSERWGAGSGCQGCRKLGHKTVEKITVFFNSCWSLEVNTAAALDSHAARPLPALLHFNGKGWFPPARL